MKNMKKIIIVIIIQLSQHFFFLPRQILKKLDMPQQNPQHLLTAEVNFEHCTIIIPIHQIVGIVVELQLP